MPTQQSAELPRLMTWLTFFLILLALWAFAKFYLSGPDLGHFDTEVGEHFKDHPDDKAATQQFLEEIAEIRKQATGTKSLTKGFAIAREFADNLSEDLDTDCQFFSTVANGVPCEWAMAPNSDPNRRVLFLHGGAFLFGSPKGHRIMSHQLSHIANAAVLSVDYRMLPENKRSLASIDSQRAYHWILENGPSGVATADKIIVAGDSAGGNLALMLSGWSKLNASRKPDAVIGFSPSLDTTLDSPTFKQNAKTDPLLGLPLGALKKLPKTLALWFGLFSMRCNPRDEVVSPLFGDLSELPPTLIHASSSEVLLGDSIRYTNKAVSAGSSVKLQIWKDQIHDWHLFNYKTGSGVVAWAEIKKFIKQTV